MIPLPSYDFRAENSKIVNLRTGVSIRSLAITFASTNDAGQTLTKSDLGSVRWIENDKTVWEANLEDIIEFNQRNRKEGTSYFSSTTAGAVLVHIEIPMRFNGDKNVVRITQPTALQFTHSSLTAILTSASNTFQVFMVDAVGIESYRPSYHRYDRTTVGSRADAVAFSEFENIAFVTLAYHAGHSQVLFTKNGDALYDLQSTQQMNMVNTLEQGLLGYNAFAADYPLVLDLYQDGNLAAVRGKRYGYNVLSSNPTCGGLVVQFNENAIGTQESARHAAKLAAK